MWRLSLTKRSSPRQNPRRCVSQHSHTGHQRRGCWDCPRQCDRPYRCNHVPPFALVSGGRDRTIFPSDAFTTIVLLSRISENCQSRKLKWVIVGVAHSHDFSSFRSSSPPNTFHASTIEQFSSLGSQNVTCGEIKMRFNVLCNKGVSRTR